MEAAAAGLSSLARGAILAIERNGINLEKLCARKAPPS